MNEIYIALAGLITIGGTGYFGFIFGKSKYVQEVEKLKVEVKQSTKQAESMSIENDVKLSNHYKEILDDLKSRYETRFKEFEDMMHRKVSLLEEENKLKDRKIKLQEQELRELRRENKTLKQNARTLIT